MMQDARYAHVMHHVRTVRLNTLRHDVVDAAFAGRAMRHGGDAAARRGVSSTGTTRFLTDEQLVAVGTQLSDTSVRVGCCTTNERFVTVARSAGT